MKILIIVLLFPFILNAQQFTKYHKDSAIILKLTDDVYYNYGQNIDCTKGDATIADSGHYMLVLGYYTCIKDNFKYQYFEINYLNNIGYVFKAAIEDYFSKEFLDSLKGKTLTEEKTKEFSKKYFDIEQKYILFELADIKKRKKAFDKRNDSLAKMYGIMIAYADVYTKNDYTDFRGFEIGFLNLSKKKIKYITFNYVGLNPVDDPVKDIYDKSFLRSSKGVGPIESLGFGSYTFENIWLSDLVVKIKLKSITIQYFDNTTATFTKFYYSD